MNFRFLDINSKLTLRNVLKNKIEEMGTWLDLDDNDTKALTKPSTITILIFTQKIVIPNVDLYHKSFSSDMGTYRITKIIYALRTGSTHASI